MTFSAEGWHRCVLRSPPSAASFSYGGGGGAVSGPPCGMQRRSKMPRSWGLFDCLRRSAQGGNQSSYPLGRLGPQYVPIRGGASATNGIPPSGLARGSVGPSPHRAQSRGGGGRPDGQEPPAFFENPYPFSGSPGPPRIQGSGGGPLLLSTPVTVPGWREGGRSTGMARGGQGPPSPSEPVSEPLRLVLSSKGAGVRGDTRGSGQTHAHCSKCSGGPLEWWAIPCVYRHARLARRWRWVLSAEGSGAHAVRGGVAGGVGMAIAGAEIRAPAKRRRLGPKVAQEAGSSAPSLVDLARLAARSGGIVRPPRDPVTQAELWDGGG